MPHSPFVASGCAPQRPIIATVRIAPDRYVRAGASSDQKLNSFISPACMPVLYKRGLDANGGGTQRGNDVIEAVVNTTHLDMNVGDSEAWAIAGVCYDTHDNVNQMKNGFSTSAEAACVVSGTVTVACTKEEMQSCPVGCKVHVDCRDPGTTLYGDYSSDRFGRCTLRASDDTSVPIADEPNRFPCLGIVVGRVGMEGIQILLHNGM